MWEDRTASLGYLATRRGGRFTFHCRPCNRLEWMDAAEVMVAHGEELTYRAFTLKVRCRRCRMPVDGFYRTLEFSSHGDIVPPGWGGFSGGQDMEESPFD